MHMQHYVHNAVPHNVVPQVSASTFLSTLSLSLFALEPFGNRATTIKHKLVFPGNVL